MVNFTEPVSLLSTFLEFFRQLKNEANKNQLNSIMSSEAREASEAFIELVEDPFRCSLSGSSLLAHRLGRDDFGSDIDFFMEDTTNLYSTPANEIVYNFLQKVQSHFPKLCGVEEKKEEYDMFSQTLQSDRNLSEYPFEVGKYMVSSFKFNLPGKTTPTTLNFIFVEHKALNSLRRVAPERVQSIASRIFSSLNHFSLQSGKVEFDNQYPLWSQNGFQGFDGLASQVSYIREGFDFEELKYVWDFQEEKPIDIFSAQLKIGDRLYPAIQAYGNRFQGMLSLRKGVEDRLENWRDKLLAFNQPGVLTLASSLYNLHDISCAYHDLATSNLDPAHHYLKQGKLFALLGGLADRIQKYENNYKFKIEDPEDILLILQSSLAIMTTKTISHPNIIKVIKRGIFSSVRPINNIIRKFSLKYVKATKNLIQEERSIYKLWLDSRRTETFNFL